MHQISQLLDAKYLKNSTVTELLIEPRELDQLLIDIASICQKIHLFDRFLKVRAWVELY